MSANAAASSVHCASGSDRCASYPAEIASRSGPCSRATGTTMRWTRRGNRRGPTPGNRKIDRVALPRPGPYLVRIARARIERALVDARVHDAIGLGEYLVRAVAVVNVPVEDQNPFGAPPRARAPRHGNVVEQAEAHRARGLRVVARVAARRTRAARRPRASCQPREPPLPRHGARRRRRPPPRRCPCRSSRRRGGTAPRSRLRVPARARAGSDPCSRAAPRPAPAPATRAARARPRSPAAAARSPGWTPVCARTTTDGGCRGPRLCRSRALPTPQPASSWDVAVVGGGAAGLYTALAAADAGACWRGVEAALGERELPRPGGLAAALTEDDLPSAHDTLKAGRARAARRPSRSSRARRPAPSRSTHRLGVRFDTDETDARARARRRALGAPHSARGWEPAGRAITGRLAELVDAHDAIEALEETSARALWSDGERCAGVVTDRGAIAASATVLATGEARRWERTTNPWGAIAAGAVLAPRGRRRVADLELFHPPPPSRCRGIPGTGRC